MISISDQVKAIAGSILGVAVLGAVAAAAFWLYDAGKTSGREENQAALNAANAQIVILTQKINDQNAAIEDLRRRAQEAQAAADAVAEEAARLKAGADAERSSFQRKLNDAMKEPKCAVLSMPLCDSVLDY